MADKTTKDVIIHIQTNVGDAINRITELQKELDQLKVAQLSVEAAVKTGQKTRQEADKELEEIAAATRSVNAEIRSLRGEIDAEVKKYKEKEGSLVAMRAELKNLRKEYESMSRAERDSAEGKELLNHIATLTDEIKDLEYAQKDFRRNVGNYMSAWDGMNGPIGKTIKFFKEFGFASGGVAQGFANLKKGAAAFGKELWKLVKNPFVAIVAAIVLVISKLVEQFKRSDEAMTALKGLMSSLEPIMDVFRGILEAVVKLLTAAVTGITKFVSAILSIVPAFKQTEDAMQQWIKREDELEEAERKYTVEHAKNEAKVAELREKALEADKYSAEERKAFMEEAIEIEKRDLEMAKANAYEKWQLAKEEAERNRDNSDETMNNLANLEAAYIQTETEFRNGVRRMKKSLSTFNRQLKKESLEAAKAMSQAYISAFESIANDANLSRKTRDKFFKMQLQEEVKAAREALQEVLDDPAATEAQRTKAQAEHAATINAIREKERSYREEKKQAGIEMSNTELAAMRALQDAIIDNLDESLEKQVKETKTAGEREIEDLKRRLKLEKNLTAKTRDAINKTIVEKQKKLDKDLLKVQSAYWSEYRQDLADFLNNVEIGANDDEMWPSGTLTNQMRDAFKTAFEGFDNDFNKVLSSFSTNVEKMAGVLKNADLTIFSEEMQDALLKMRDFKEEWKGSDKDMDKWLTNFERLMEKFPDEIYGLRTLTYPYLKNIEDVYQKALRLPEEYGRQMILNTDKSLKEWSKKVREGILKNVITPIRDDAAEFAVQWLSSYFPEEMPVINSNKWGEQVAREFTDGLVSGMQANLNLQKIISPVELIPDAVINKAFLNDKALDRIADDFGVEVAQALYDMISDLDLSDPTAIYEMQSKIEEYLSKATIKPTFKLDWNGNEELEQMFGTELENSVSGLLKMLTGLENESDALKFLAENYDLVIDRLRKYNIERTKAYAQNGSTDMYMAEVDESMVVPQFARMAENMRLISDSMEDYEMRRLKIQSEYWNNEEVMQAKLAEMEAERASNEAAKYQQHLDYLIGLRDTVAQSEADYLRTRAEGMRDLGVLNDQYEILQSKLASLEDQGSDEYLNTLQQMESVASKIGEIQTDIERAKDKLAGTGYTGVAELETDIDNANKKIIESNLTVQKSTNDAANNYTRAWLASFTTVTGGAGKLASSFQNLFEQMGEDAEQYQAFAEAASYASIGIAMAEGIAEAIAAGAGQPFPYNLAAIATGVAAVVAGIAEALSVYKQYHSKSPKYATGGPIEKGTTKRADDVPIWVSRGEYVINADAVERYGKDFFDAINFGHPLKGINRTGKFADGGQVTSINQVYKTVFEVSAMREAFAEAVEGITPVVSVKEITTVQNRVKAKETIAKR